VLGSKVSTYLVILVSMWELGALRTVSCWSAYDACWSACQVNACWSAYREVRLALLHSQQHAAQQQVLCTGSASRYADQRAAMSLYRATVSALIEANARMACS
jgi:hypothetical protein